MRNLSEHDGVFITDDLVSRLNRAVQLEGRQSKLARIMNVPENNLSNWLGKTKKTSSMISWEQWAKVRSYLIKAELIDAEDPRWMLPSQMRERLMAIRDSSDVTARQSAVNNGTNNGSMTVNNQTAGGSEPLKAALRSAILKSDMCSDCKVKILTLLETI